jgi:glycosyltransferase involved in cell wall biosynthesis
MFEKDITIGIKTFLRPSSLKYCLMRLRQRYPKVTIFVADDSSEEFKKLNRKWARKYNALYFNLAFDTGLGYGRNQMINSTTTKYYLTLDDDSLVDDRFNLEKLYNLIEDTHMDLISCQRGVSKRTSKHYYHYFHSVEKVGSERYGQYIVKYDKKMLDSRKIKNNLGLTLYKTHLVNENYIGKTSVMKKNLYENDIKIGQHQLHFSKLYLNNVTIGYCPDIVIGERPNYPEEYLKYRGRKGLWVLPTDVKMIEC